MTEKNKESGDHGQDLEQALKEKHAAIQKYAPGIQQGLTQADVDRIIAQLSMDKIAAEKHINYLADLVISIGTERDRLAAENAVLKSQLAIHAMPPKGSQE